MAGSGVGIDVGTTGGKWLFKQDELLLGPVPFPKLIELLYAGEVTGQTLIAPSSDPGQFHPLQSVEAFRLHIAKAQAKLRVEAQSHAQRKSLRRGGQVRLLLGGVLGVVLLGGGAMAAVWLANHRPWEKKVELPEPLISEELPQIKMASARPGDVELDYPDPAASGRPAGERPVGKKPPRPGSGALASAEPGAGRPAGHGGGGAQGDEDDVQSVQQWDQEAINGVVASNKKSLHRCLSEEARRQGAAWSASIPIEFTIGNDGRVTKLWIDNREYKSEESDLHRCMLSELKKWHFPNYQGEQANVSLAFHVGAR